MAADDRGRRAAYYASKRIGQQWRQVSLLNELPARRVLELGPYFGPVTAMLVHAGYDVTTFDNGPRRFERAFQLMKLRFLERFRPPPEPGGHQWEIGYRGFGLGAWERRLEVAGWRIWRRTFTHPCRSVFHVLEAG